MKTFTGIFVTFIIIAILVTFSISIIIPKLVKDIDNELVDIKSNLGKNVVIKKDTLMIMDYSIIKDSYILENGIEVNMDLILNDKLEIID